MMPMRLSHQRQRVRCLVALFSGVIFLSAAWGCASSAGGMGGRGGGGGGGGLETTMLTSVDLVQMTAAMARSLLASGIDFRGSAAEGNPFIIVTDRVVNRTNHIIETGEKELFLTKLRVLLNQQPALKAEGVIFVARPDELSIYSELPANPEMPTPQFQGPTHALTATFATLTNIDRQQRTDTYECAFQLQELKSRLIVWEDAYTVRYSTARGKMW